VMKMINIFAIGLALMMPLALAQDADGFGNEDGNQEEGPDNDQSASDDSAPASTGAVNANDVQSLADAITGPQQPSQLIQKTHATPPAFPMTAPAVASSPAAAQPAKDEVKVHAMNAKKAAKVAKQAAKVANKVAKHSMKIVGHSKKALTHALGALHDARVESNGLGKAQKQSLKKAEAHLREATKTAEYGQLKKTQDEKDAQREKMEADLKKRQGGLSEKERMRQEIQELRRQLKQKNIDDKDIHQALDDLEADLDKTNGPINDESKAELERLRQLVDSLDAQEPPEDKSAKDKSAKDKSVEKMRLEDEEEKKRLQSEKNADTESGGAAAVKVEQKGFDIDTAMPYGDLEPFGREDTAQELTESSITQSDEMVDQLERAEVAEEKRSVFRALTRLRGAAITSFDGVARSQTGNIDEYNKIHQWRSTHPLHHLADEESDVSKWAFPDNAD